MFFKVIALISCFFFVVGVLNLCTDVTEIKEELSNIVKELKNRSK